MGASQHRMKLWFRGEGVLIKRVFHLTRKENIRKTKEVLTNQGSFDCQFRYLETVCVKVLH